MEEKVVVLDVVALSQVRQSTPRAFFFHKCQ